MDCAGDLGAVSEKCGATSGAALGLGGVDDLGTAPPEYITVRSPSGSDVAGMFVLGACDAGALGAVENANGTLGEAGGIHWKHEEREMASKAGLWNLAWRCQ